LDHQGNDKTHPRVPPESESISLVLPAWNEAEALPRAIEEADVALRRVARDYEIIVVDDGSRDGTADCVRQIAATNQAIRLIRHETNQGYGAALRSGFTAARCDLVVYTDADGQFDLAELDRFVLLADDYHVVCGYRIDRKDSALRCFYSRAYNLLVNLLLGPGVRDVDCALKMFHRDVLRELRITTNGFLVDTELLTQARQRNCSVVEVGVSHRPRTAGQSTVSIAHIPVVIASLLRYWWNHVQFPGGDATGGVQAPAIGPQPSKHRLLGAQVVLLLAAAVLLLSGLDYPLIDRDETRYAEIPREMVDTGNWILPQLNYRPYYDKPALLYWLCAGSYSIFGVSEWAARLVPAVCGLGTLLATMWFGSRLLGGRSGLLAAAVLLLSAGFLGASRVLLIDGVLTFCTTISLFAAYEALRGRAFQLRWWTVASVACGIAFLAKGPIALVLLFPTVHMFGWLTEGVSRPRMRHWLMLAGIVAAIASPWFVAVSCQDPQFAYEFFYKHNVSRFAGAFHERPFWYFFPVLMIAAHPWSFLTIPFLGFLTGRSDQIRRRRTRPIGFLLLWSAWCLTFFSVSRCKLPPYILPAAPAMALMIGHYLEHVLFSRCESWCVRCAREWAPWLAAGTTCLAGVGFGVLALVTDLESPSLSWTMITIWVIILALVITLRHSRTSSQVGWSVCAASTLLLAGLVLHREMPRYARAQTVFGQGSPLAADLAAAEQPPIVTVGHEWAGIPFNLRRNDIRNCQSLSSPELSECAAEHRRILIVMRRKQDMAELLHYLPERTHLTTIAERGPARLVMATAREQYENAARSDRQTLDLR